MHTCTHAHMHTCTHAHMHTYTHTHIHTTHPTEPCDCVSAVPPLSVSFSNICTISRTRSGMSVRGGGGASKDASDTDSIKHISTSSMSIVLKTFFAFDESI